VVCATPDETALAAKEAAWRLRCKWLNLSGMVEINHFDFRNFLSLPLFQ